MNAGDICNREVVVCEGTASVLEAAQLMREQHVGDVVVVEERPAGRVPIGIVTDRDVAIGVVAKRLNPATTRVVEVLVGDLVTAREDEDLLDVLERMRSDAVRRLPVVNDRGTLEGILTFDDVLDVVAQMTDHLSSLVGRQAFQEERMRGLPR